MPYFSKWPPRFQQFRTSKQSVPIHDTASTRHPDHPQWVYVKSEPDEPTPVPCRRCPDYLPYGGIWKLSFNNAVYRVQYMETGWRSVGSFTLSGDRIAFFNDANCPFDVGTYVWKFEDRALTLKVIDDPCSFGLRALNFARYPWASCQPGNREAAVSDHWQKPRGCE